MVTGNVAAIGVLAALVAIASRRGGGATQPGPAFGPATPTGALTGITLSQATSVGKPPGGTVTASVTWSPRTFGPQGPLATWNYGLTMVLASGSAVVQRILNIVTGEGTRTDRVLAPIPSNAQVGQSFDVFVVLTADSSNQSGGTQGSFVELDRVHAGTVSVIQALPFCEARPQFNAGPLCQDLDDTWFLTARGEIILIDSGFRPIVHPSVPSEAGFGPPVNVGLHAGSRVFTNEGPAAYMAVFNGGHNTSGGALSKLEFYFIDFPRFKGGLTGRILVARGQTTFDQLRADALANFNALSHRGPFGGGSTTSVGTPYDPDWLLNKSPAQVFAERSGLIPRTSTPLDREEVQQLIVSGSFGLRQLRW